MFAVIVGSELFKVAGEVNEDGWLIWRDWHGRGDQGISQPGRWCDWSERQAVFPDAANEDLGSQ